METLTDRLRSSLDLPEATDEEILRLAKGSLLRTSIIMEMAIENIRSMYPCVQEAAEALCRFAKSFHDYEKKLRMEENNRKLEESKDRF